MKANVWLKCSWLALLSCSLLLGFMAKAADKSILVVFDVEVKGAKLSAETKDRLTDYLGSLMASRGYKVVPRSQLKERLLQEKKGSYRQCYEQSCQIEIGKELAAQKSLATQVLKFGQKCKVTLTLFDLLQAASEGAGTASGSCDESGVVESLENGVANLLSLLAPKNPEPETKPVQAKPVETKPAEKKPEPAVVATPQSPLATVYDANTVLLDHFDNSTSASILAYSEDGASCGRNKPTAVPSSSFTPSRAGLQQALTLGPPAGQPASSSSYIKYGGGQILTQPNGTIEFWVYLTSYGHGLSLMDQGPFYVSCAGWTIGIGVTPNGQLTASAWNAFDMNSGSTIVPLNTWTHVATTWGSSGAKLYINGKQAGSDSSTGMPAANFGGSLMMRLGTHSGYSASIDELRVSNIQRTSFPIQ